LLAASDVDDALKILRDIIGLPPWIISILTVLVALRVLYRPVFEVLSPIYKLFINHVVPIFYTPERRAKVRDRQMFAEHVEGEIGRYNAKEDWTDRRFAELDAEVEVEDSNQRFWIVSRLLPTAGLRRERSLTGALRHSADRQVLLVGDPGSVRVSHSDT
jgi:hypothetical protein